MYTHTHTHTENEKQNTQKDEKNRRKGPTTQNRRREAAHIKLADKWVRMYAKKLRSCTTEGTPTRVTGEKRGLRESTGYNLHKW